MSDVDKNAFQFINGSHKYSEKYDNELYLSPKFIDDTYKADVLSFKMKTGSIILCDTHGIHRDEPFTDEDYKRTTLPFQVDQVGRDNERHGEQNIVNTKYLCNLKIDCNELPGVWILPRFGFKRNYPAFPNSSLGNLTIHDILSLQKQLIPKPLRPYLKASLNPYYLTN